MTQKKKALFNSGIALLLCISMLLGTTWAWFTDSVVSTANVISTGTLKVGLYHTNAAVATQTKVTNETKDLFQVELWEPGVAAYENFTVKNEGSLWLKYQLGLNALDQNYVQRGANQFRLSEALVAGVVKGGISDSNNDGTVTREEAIGQITEWEKLNEVLETGFLAPEGEADTVTGTPVTDTTDYGIVIWWQPTGNDNNWNVNNGKSTSDGTPLTVDLGVTLSATQYSREEDSFGSEYDGAAEFPELDLPVKVTVAVPSENGTTTQDVTMVGRDVTATVPAGVKLADGVQALTLTVTEMEQSNANITTGATEDMVSLDVHIDGVDVSNTTPIIVDLGPVMPKYLNMGNYELYHVENGATNPMTMVDTLAELDAHNEFLYDLNTGNLTVALATFSEVLMVADVSNPWNGDFSYGWYENGEDGTYTISNADELAGFGAIVGGMNDQRQDSFAGKTVKLIADIDLDDAEESNDADKIFYPIGYYNSTGNYTKSSGGSVSSTVQPFEGTFNGQGHTIANFYQNTWEMFGDYNDGYSGTPNHYKDAMGLFGSVYNAVVKNLTIENFSSDGEYTPTGCVAAFAGGNSTFENIAITNCNPRVYNTGNGGIVGLNYNSTDGTPDNLIFRNITVDNTNTISALWGSYDVSCGGILGRLRDSSKHDNKEGGTHNTVKFVNCHAAATMDVNNDVCGNYQYYQYRYSGSLIGTVDYLNETPNISKEYVLREIVSAENTTVHYGDWNDYYYCEFVKNGHPSYSGPDDYKFSRVPHSELDFTDANGNGVVDVNERNSVVGCLHDHEDVEDNRAIYLPFNQLFTGYGWGASHVEVGDLDGVKILDREVADSETKFETKFTGDFLYRVGNKNAVELGSLFAAKDGVTINDSGVVASIVKVDENMNVSGTFTENASDWTKGTIQFKGTGVVKVTIQDYNFCTPTELYLEVVDATNHSSASISSLGSGNVVLLCDTKLNNNGALALQNASLYGNGFTVDVTAGRTRGESISANYLLYMNNATLDNTQVVGAVYTNFDVISSNEWNNPVILSVGDSTIANSYVANCASPVRFAGDKLTIINSTLKGGFFANVDVRGGNLVLDNVTTINQANLNDTAADGTEIAGMGIVVFYEGPASGTTITVKNNLTQHNYLANVESKNSYANMLLEEIFESGKYGDFIYTDASGMQWANTGIISLYEGVDNDNIIITDQTNKNAYTGTSLSYSNSLLGGTATGYLYTTNPKTICDAYEFVPSVQYEVVPKVTIDHTINKVIKTDDSETSCTSDSLTDQENITFANGDSFEWDVNVLKSSNKKIAYTVWVDGVQYTDKVVFDESGTHNVVFKYSDASNYRKNGDAIEQYTAEYETSMVIVVSEKAPTAKSAEITFPLLNSYGTTKVTVDGKNYIMPNLTGTNIPVYDADFDATTRKYGSVKVDGRSTVDIYYPIIKTAVDGNILSANMVFPVFGNGNGTLVQIQDYADGGAGGAMAPSDASTQTLPTNLSVVRGYTVQWKTDKDVAGSGSMSYGNWVSGVDCMRYQTAAGTAVECAVKGGYLSYYPSININTNDRNEQVQVVEYKYVDNKGDTYYYCVGYHIEERNSGYAFGETVPEDTGGTCVTPDTLVTLADGSQKRIDEVTYADQLLVWDFYRGEYTAVPSALIVNHGEDVYDVIELTFEDGTVVKAVNGHAFFDVDLNEMVLLTPENAKSYVGDMFAKMDGDEYTAVKLVACEITKEFTGSYTLVSAGHYNFFVEEMFSLTNSMHPLLVGLEVGENMRYDVATLKAEREKFGQYTYDDFADYITYEQFIAFNGPDLKISVEKGEVSFEFIIGLIHSYVLDESVRIID